LNYSNYSSW